MPLDLSTLNQNIYDAFLNVREQMRKGTYFVQISGPDTSLFSKPSGAHFNAFEKNPGFIWV